MLKGFKRKIEEHRGSKSFFWKKMVEGKDAVFYSGIYFFSMQIGFFRHLPYMAGILPAKKFTLPDFLGIGAQKSATTWLDKMLRYHPDLFLPLHKKEIRYFELFIIKSLKWYSGHFNPGKGKTKGEISPGYATLPLYEIRLINKIMPDVKLIFMMRNPITRAWSSALMGFILQKKRNYESVAPSQFYAHFNSRLSRFMGDYSKCIDNWLRFFPEEQLFLGYFEDVARRPKKLLQDVFVHLGVSPDIDWKNVPFSQKVNVNKDKIPMPREYYDHLYGMYAEKIENLYERLGNPIIKRWLKEKPWK
jgi:hypothetical protein